ncbi:MAG: TfoX/Sxy family protein, partial [Nitrospiraceae bacterium]|nr:TfoX/Sxy family protein [Nitrospiraceae bacterium]
MPHALVDHCLELLAPLGAVRAKRMFGGYGLYVEELFIAVIAFERLYLKVDAAGMPRFSAAGCEPFVYGGKGKPIE